MNFKFRSILGRLYGAYALRAILFASFSAIAAFSVADAFRDFISPTIASIIALTAIKTNVSDTVKETIKQVVGSFFGAILGILLVTWIGFNALSLFIAVSLSIGIVILLKMEVHAGLAIAATVVLVSGPLLGDYQSIEQRVAGVIVGSIFAFMASLLMLPLKPDKNILEKILKRGEETVAVLDEISLSFAGANKFKIVEIEDWLSRINKNISDIKLLTQAADQLYLDSKWTPFVTAASADNIKRQAEIAKINAAAIKTIIIAIENSSEHKVELSDSASRKIAKLLEVSSFAIKQQLFTAMTNPATPLTHEVAEDIRARRGKLASAMTKMDDTRAIMLGGTIMHEATKIKNLITDVNK
jgi:uncharacterized membrane protein YgaE (UPF0421/DUF939 family)